MDGYGGMGATRNIPLICTVCPESPRFSDVSHLLTHIASKGHLHHETQTKLKAHQDLVAAVALQQYDQWYQDNGIEALLVERLKAKQAKEALKDRQNRSNVAVTPINPPPRPKKRGRRAVNDAAGYIPQDYTEPIPIYPGLLAEENETEMLDDMLHTADTMALKGQIWPGMGKMDLANEDMKRTRNQRKPKSAIDRMRRTSEGIEPTQVVMTSDFEVERVKGVYDSSSPIPGQEEVTPPPIKRATRPRKKREPLADLSVNIPVGDPDQASASLYTRTARLSRKKNQMPPVYESSLLQRASMLSHNIFRDGTSSLNVYNDRPIAATPHQHSKTLHYDHLSMHSINPISQPAMAAQLTTSRDPFPYGRESPSGLPDMKQNHYTPTLAHHTDPPASLSASVFGGPSRLALAMTNHFSAYDRFQYQDNQSNIPKHEDYMSLTGHGSLLNSSPSFLNLSENNPLLSQDQPVLKSYLQSPDFQSLSEAHSVSGFKPINLNRNITGSATAAQPPMAAEEDDIKIESQLCDIVQSSLNNDDDGDNFDTSDNWARSDILDGLPIELGHEDSGA